MRKLISVTAAALILLAVPQAAGAAKRVPYKGKTTGGHKVTFKLAKGKLWNFVTGVPMTCLSIQGGGAPISGAEVWNFKWVDLGLKNYKFSEMSKPSFHYNEVTRNHTVTTRRAGRRAIRGAIRVQYSFMTRRSSDLGSSIADVNVPRSPRRAR
jgi:hypothetical protein